MIDGWQQAVGEQEGLKQITGFGPPIFVSLIHIYWSLN